MKKTLSVLLAVSLLATLFSGCFFPSQGSTPSQPAATPAATTPEATSSETASATGHTGPSQSVTIPYEPHVPITPARISKEEELAVGFVDALLNEDYAAALDMLSSSVYPNALVFEEDLPWAIPRTDFRVLEYIDPATVQYATFLDSNGAVTVTLTDANGGKETVIVRTEIPKDGDGSPRVNGGGDFYRSRYSFRTPSNVQIQINGVDVDKSLITKKNTGSISMFTDWTVPVIGVKDKTIRIYCDNYDATETFTPKSFSDPQKDSDCRFAPDYEDAGILLTVKDIWNRMFSIAVADGAKPSDLQEYIAGDADPDTAQIILDGYRDLDVDKNKNMKMTQAVFRTDASSFWVNDHCLAVNFGYELTWDFYGNKEMRRLSNIILAREGDEWKVCRITDSGLFCALNYFTSQW